MRLEGEGSTDIVIFINFSTELTDFMSYNCCWSLAWFLCKYSLVLSLNIYLSASYVWNQSCAPSTLNMLCRSRWPTQHLHQKRQAHLWRSWSWRMEEVIFHHIGNCLCKLVSSWNCESVINEKSILWVNKMQPAYWVWSSAVWSRPFWVNARLSLEKFGIMHQHVVECWPKTNYHMTQICWYSFECLVMKCKP